MRQRKLTALMLSAAMSISAFAAFTVTASAEAEAVNVFTANNAETYEAIMNDITAYDSTAAPIKEIQSYSWGIQAKFDNNGYNSNTGVKIDITDAIKGKKGTFAISADFTCFYWGNNLEDGDEVDSWNQVKLFLETADGTQTAIAQGPDTKNGNDAALNGEIEYDATVETTYYLCFKQPSGQHQYKNISITYTAPETVTPAETEVEITGGYFWANDSYPAPEGYVVENGALKKEGTDEQVHVKQGYIENATFNKINVTVTWHPGEADEKSEMKTLDVGGTITGPAVFYVLLGMDGYQSHTVTATAVAE